MYEIMSYCESKDQLDNFLKLTANFGKKFYIVRYDDQTDRRTMNVKAIAISRDLTYILEWNIHMKKDHDDEKFLKNSCIVWITLDSDVEKIWEPYGDERNVFELNGFIEVDLIKKDGQNI